MWSGCSAPSSRRSSSSRRPSSRCRSCRRTSIVTRDEREGRGPLEGLRAGLKALPDSVEIAYVTSCDVPLLVPAFVERMIELLGDHDIAVMEIDGFPHPLSAVYRRDTLPHVEALLAQDRLRPVFLFDAVRTRRVQPAEMIVGRSGAADAAQSQYARRLSGARWLIAGLAGLPAALTMILGDESVELLAAE